MGRKSLTTNMENRFLELLDIEKCKQLISECPEDEIVILCPHYSINIASFYEDGEQLQWDFDDFDEAIGEQCYVNDYDDLCCNPHGIELA